MEKEHNTAGGTGATGCFRGEWQLPRVRAKAMLPTLLGRVGLARRMYQLGMLLADRSITTQTIPSAGRMSGVGALLDIERVLNQVVQILRDLIGSRCASAHLMPYELPLLKASALTLLGRVHRDLEKNDVAQEDFDRAYDLFKNWLPHTPNPTGQSFSDYGIVLWMRGLEEEAVATFRQAVALGIHDLEAYHRLGVYLQRNGRPEEAEVLLRGYLDFNPSNCDALQAFGESLQAQGKPDEAALAFEQSATSLAFDNCLQDSCRQIEQALSLSPDDPGLLTSKSEILRLSGQNKDGLKTIEKALALAPHDGLALCAKGTIQRALGLDEEAERTLRQCLELDPQQAWAYGELLDILRHRGASEEALKAFDMNRDNPGWALVCKGLTLGQLGRYDEALDKIDEALLLLPNKSQAIKCKAYVLYLMGRDKEAFDLLNGPDADIFRTKVEMLAASGNFQDALDALTNYDVREQHPHPSPATRMWLCVTRWKLLLKVGKYDEAEQALSKALALESDENQREFLKNLAGGDAASQNLTGRYLNRVNRFEDAEKTLRRALDLDSDIKGAHIALGQALRRLGRLEPALEQLDLALQENPDDPMALVEKGLVLLAIDDPNRYPCAMEAFTRAAKLDKHDVTAFWGQGEVHRLKGEHKEAENALMTALELSSNKDLASFRSLGEVYLKEYQIDKAIENFKQAAELDPEDASVFSFLGVAYKLRDDYDTSMKYLDRSLAIDPQDHLTLYRKGNILCECGEYKQAIDVLSKAIDAGSTDARIYAIMGWALEYSAEYYDALQAFRKALELKGLNRSGYLWVKRELADTLGALARKEEAMQLYQEVLQEVEKSNDSSEFVIALSGWCNFKLGLHDKAEQLFIEALQQTPDNISNQYDLALVLLSRGDDTRGTREYQHGMNMSRGKSPRRRCGLISVALRDLELAVKENQNPKARGTAQKVMGMLNESLDEVKKEISNSECQETASL
ncbi:MAG: tetratricopeptide repeat protein [Syntrophobacteraceae bacterium]